MPLHPLKKLLLWTTPPGTAMAVNQLLGRCHKLLWRIYEPTLGPLMDIEYGPFPTLDEFDVMSQPFPREDIPF